MKFLCLISADRTLEQMSEAEAAQHLEDDVQLTAAIRASGHLIDCNRLRPARTATTVRVRDGEVTTTDGPFAETKEQLGGSYLVEAEDHGEAIALAARIPGSWIGSVEVRQIADDAATPRALGYPASRVDDAAERKRG